MKGRSQYGFGQGLYFGKFIGLKEHLFISIVAGLVVSFMLYAFEPFELQSVPVQVKKTVAIGCGLIASFVIFVFERYVPRMFAKTYSQYSWTTWLMVFHIAAGLSTAGLLNCIFLEYVLKGYPEYKGMLNTLLNTLLSGLIPMLGMLTWHYILYLRELNRSEVRLLPDVDDDKDSSINTNDEIFGIAMDQIMVCTAMGNYCRIFVRIDGEVVTKVIRTTLSDLLLRLPEQTFMQCHRSHIVHIPSVKTYDGNSKGLQLFLDGIEFPIKVSRNYVSRVKMALEEVTHA